MRIVRDVAVNLTCHKCGNHTRLNKYSYKCGTKVIMCQSLPGFLMSAASIVLIKIFGLSVRTSEMIGSDLHAARFNSGPSERM